MRLADHCRCIRITLLGPWINDTPSYSSHAISFRMGGGMKRLLVCFDGTWNSAGSERAETNATPIARTTWPPQGRLLLRFAVAAFCLVRLCCLRSLSRCTRAALHLVRSCLHEVGHEPLSEPT
jgi:hypothetical protein